MSFLKVGYKSLAYIVIGLLAVLVLCFVFSPTWGIHGITNFYLHMFRHERPAEPVLICIDDASLQKYGRWPWSRRTISRLVAAASAARPKAIGLDILLTEKSADDAQLAQTFRTGQVVCLAEYLNLRQKTSLGKTTVYRGRIEEPVADLKRAAAGTGFIDVFVSPDDTVQSMRLKFGNHRSLASSLIQIAFPGFQINQDALNLKIAAKPRDFLQISALRILEGKAENRLKGKIVLIGITATGVADRYRVSATSLGRIPGVYLHAYETANLLEWGGLYHMPLCFILFFTSILTCWLVMKPFYKGLKTIVWVIPAFFALSVILYARGIWASPLYPTTAVICALFAKWLWFTLDLSAEKNRTRGNLKKYLSPVLLDNIGAGLDVGPPVIRNVSVLFADLRGYTGMAEQFSPAEVVAVLNKLLGIMADIIIENGGVVDKFTGDGILAFFQDNPGKQAGLAVKAAMEIQQACLAQDNKPGAGIGIATGPVSIGCIGSKERQDYTVIGDTVNIAARLEKLAGQGEIILEETTAQAAGVSGNLRSVSLKGRQDPVKVITLTPTDY